MTKKTKLEKIEENSRKKFTVVYTIGNDPVNYATEADDYKLSTLEIQSPSTGEIFSFPVVFLINEDSDTMEIVPMNSLGSLKYNYGYAEEQKMFISQMKKMKETMKEKIAEGKPEEKSNYHG